jgi:hypothetical protein
LTATLTATDADDLGRRDLRRTDSEVTAAHGRRQTGCPGLTNEGSTLAGFSDTCDALPMPTSLQEWWNGLSTVDQLVLVRDWGSDPVTLAAVLVLRRSGLHIPGGRWELREERSKLYWHPQLQRFLAERAGFVDRAQRHRGTR